MNPLPISSPTDISIHLCNIDDKGLRTAFEDLETYGFTYTFLFGCVLWSMSPESEPNYLNTEIEVFTEAFTDIVEDSDESDPVYHVAKDYFANLGHITETLHSAHSWYKEKFEKLGLDYLSDLEVRDAKSINSRRMQLTVSDHKLDSYGI